MAIAFDASSGVWAGGVTSQTVSHTCTGSDRCLVVNVVVDGTDTCTGVTYNGVAMTQTGKVLAGSYRYIYVYTLLAPATGANNIVASISSSGFLEVNAASYTGVAQTGQPEATVTNSGSSGASTLTTTVTTLTDNAWAVMSVLGTAGALAAGAGTTKRASSLVGGVFDSGAAITPAGAAPLIFTMASAEMGAISVSLAPSAGGDTTAPTLTSPTGTQTGSTTASGTVSTDEGNGTLYYLASTNATETAATVKAASSQAVSGTGSQSVSFIGLTASTTYYAHYCHRDAAGNDSTVSNSASLTTAAASSAKSPAFYQTFIAGR